MQKPRSAPVYQECEGVDKVGRHSMPGTDKFAHFVQLLKGRGRFLHGFECQPWYLIQAPIHLQSLAEKHAAMSAGYGVKSSTSALLER